MPEYIERGGRYFPTPFSTEEKGDYRQGWNHCLRAIYQQATADVKPVVRGKWMNEEQEGFNVFSAECDQCRKRTLAYFHYNFCPNCGADMREVT